jgi:uncharacterized protein (TIGR02246 family)
VIRRPKFVALREEKLAREVRLESPKLSLANKRHELPRTGGTQHETDISDVHRLPLGHGSDPPVCADPASDKAIITERLHRWTTAFNTGDARGVCDLFAPNLVVTIPGELNGDQQALCRRLNALLAKPELHLHYDNPDIRKIIVAGDIAVVRLFWTLTARKGGEQDTTQEAGMDIFERQPDGKWSIARFISFTANASKILEP